MATVALAVLLAGAIAPGSDLIPVKVMLCADAVSPCQDDGPPPPPLWQCEDGTDNDHDGLVDYDDGGCSGAEDNDECDSKYHNGEAVITTSGGGYATKASVSVWWISDGWYCPGPLVIDSVGLEQCWGNAAWSYTECARKDPPPPDNGGGETSSWRCISASCSMAVSPHTLTAQVIPYDASTGASLMYCRYEWTAAIPEANLGETCTQYG